MEGAVNDLGEGYYRVYGFVSVSLMDGPFGVQGFYPGVQFRFSGDVREGGLEPFPGVYLPGDPTYHHLVVVGLLLETAPFGEGGCFPRKEELPCGGVLGYDGEARSHRLDLAYAPGGSH